MSKRKLAPLALVVAVVYALSMWVVASGHRRIVVRSEQCAARNGALVRLATGRDSCLVR